LGIGISVYDMRASDLLALACAADRLGFDALWLGEHVVMPGRYRSEHPTRTDHDADRANDMIVTDSTELLDPMVTLGAIAGATLHLKLATCIYLMALRHPIITARAVYTLHEVSGGRALFADGSGWHREEFEVLGIPFETRARQLTEGVAILRSALAGGVFEYEGEIFHLPPVQVCPHEVQVPIILGGNSEPALRRAVADADGWVASGNPSLDEALQLRDRIHQLAQLAGRPAPRLWFRVVDPTPGLVDRYQAEGIPDIIVWAQQVWLDVPAEQRSEHLAQFAAEFGLVASASAATGTP